VIVVVIVGHSSPADSLFDDFRHEGQGEKAAALKSDLRNSREQPKEVPVPRGGGYHDRQEIRFTTVASPGVTVDIVMGDLVRLVRKWQHIHSSFR